MTNTAVVSYTCDRGEDFAGFDVYGHEDGDQLVATDALTCDVKQAINGSQVPPSSSPVLLTLTPPFTPASGNEPSRFIVTMTGAETTQLEAGNYITTPKLVRADGLIIVGHPVRIVVREVTG